MIHAVILAGGSGARLWPFSRAARPKQFLAIDSEFTMFQETINRLDNLDIKSTVTICNEDHRFFVAEQLHEINCPGSIILEPVGRNTAPALALAAMSLQIDHDPLLLVLSADHVINDKKAFTKAVQEATPYAESGKLVTFGVVPNKPHVGYGYIKKGSESAYGYVVDKYIEKPSLERANKYFKSGNYLWNSGMFLFKASQYLAELEIFQPEIFHACKLATNTLSEDNDFIRVNKDAFYNCPNDSIDYAVMEKTKNGIVIPLDASWNDIGSWSSLWDISKKDKNGNVLIGDTLAQNTSNSFIKSDSNLVCTIGVDDLVIISTKDSLLVANKNDVESVKKITEMLKENSRSEWQFHREVFRPWGKYESIEVGEGYQTKKLTVNPGAKLSVQKHYHRSEHWVVVSGVAKVTNGDKTFILNKNESTYIPIDTIHSLENYGETPLEIIEVQCGSYLGEDDIVRFDDIYGRVESS